MSHAVIRRSFADPIASLTGDDVQVRLPFRLHRNGHLNRKGLLRLTFPAFHVMRRLACDAAAAPTCAIGLDLLHATYFLGAPPADLPCPLVSTLHDMTPAPAQALPAMPAA
ncbi:MAG: hypothetical protein WCK64_10950 [Synechococcaceae cyanobacterium ELA445]